MKKIAFVLCFILLLVGCFAIFTGCNEQSWQDLARKQGYDVETVEVNKEEFVTDEELREALVSVTKVILRVDEEAEPAGEVYVFEFKQENQAARYLELTNVPDEIIGAGSVSINNETSVYGVYALKGFGPLIATIEVECMAKATK